MLILKSNLFNDMSVTDLTIKTLSLLWLQFYSVLIYTFLIVHTLYVDRLNHVSAGNTQVTPRGVTYLKELPFWCIQLNENSNHFAYYSR